MGYHPKPPDTSPTCPPGIGGLYPTVVVNTKLTCWSFYPIVAQTASALTLQYDWNGSGDIQTSGRVNDPFDCPTGTAACRGEQVTYSWSGTTLSRQEVGDPSGTQPVATGISALTITYWQDPDTTTVPFTPRLATSRENIRSVQIVLKATTATAVSPTTITMMDQIRLRTR